MPGYRPESVHAQLEGLAAEGVLVPVRSEPVGFNPTFTALLEELGLDTKQTIERLAATRVAIFGLEAHGAHVAKMLADSGVGTLVLADPFPFH